MGSPKKKMVLPKHFVGFVRKKQKKTGFAWKTHWFPCFSDRFLTSIAKSLSPAQNRVERRAPQERREAAEGPQRRGAAAGWGRKPGVPT